MAGVIGHLLVLTSFVACALAGIAYFRTTRSNVASEWRTTARAAWGVMVVTSFGAFVMLGYTVVTHQFQYAYVYEHSSLELPVQYLISATWAGQEGSFLLWIILNGVVGLGLIKWAKDFEGTTMSVIALCQFFLLSMIVGLKIGAIPIGASPFMTLADKFPDAPMLQAGLVPADGSGLNDLLQNYWMVIHPPTLFMGFAAMIVPFAYAVSAMWKRRYTDWVKPALPWTLGATMILGIGIAMGGYWAYVTLSFGGYWAWDPVENSSLVPWLIGIAALHTMIIQKRSGNSHKAALLLSVMAYMFVVYSTFLTRSGILGDISVHSFVDLGLYNQLLLWILSMGVIGFGLFAYRFKELPAPRSEPSLISRESMIFIGAMLVVATAIVVILGTSAPVIGRIFRDNPSTVPIAFYNKWALPLSICIVFLAGLGQLFWWNKMSLENANRILMKPVALAVVSTVLVLIFTPFVERSVRVVQEIPALTAVQAALFDGLGNTFQAYGPGLLLLMLLFVAFFALYGNGLVAWRVSRGNPKLAGGALSHVGFAVMVIGIIASSGFSRPVTRPVGAPVADGGRENFVVNLGETVRVNDYLFSYVGTDTGEMGRPAFVLDVTDPSGQNYRLKPVTYKSKNDQWIQHPDLRLGAVGDLFVAVSPSAMFDDSGDGPAVITLTKGDSTVVGNDEYLVSFLGFDMAGEQHSGQQISVGARIRVSKLSEPESEARLLTPLYVVDQDTTVQFRTAEVEDWGLSIAFTGMNVNSGAVQLSVAGVEGQPKDWLVVQAYEKPMISLVWIGIILLSIGFTLSILRRSLDLRARPAGGPAAA